MRTTPLPPEPAGYEGTTPALVPPPAAGPPSTAAGANSSSAAVVVAVAAAAAEAAQRPNAASEVFARSRKGVVSKVETAGEVLLRRKAQARQGWNTFSRKGKKRAYEPLGEPLPADRVIFRDSRRKANIEAIFAWATAALSESANRAAEASRRKIAHAAAAARSNSGVLSAGAGVPADARLPAPPPGPPPADGRPRPPASHRHRRKLRELPDTHDMFANGSKALHAKVAESTARVIAVRSGQHVLNVVPSVEWIAPPDAEVTVALGVSSEPVYAVDLTVAGNVFRADQSATLTNVALVIAIPPSALSHASAPPPAPPTEPMPAAGRAPRASVFLTQVLPSAPSTASLAASVRDAESGPGSPVSPLSLVPPPPPGRIVYYVYEGRELAGRYTLVAETLSAAALSPGAVGPVPSEPLAVKLSKGMHYAVVARWPEDALGVVARGLAIDETLPSPRELITLETGISSLPGLGRAEVSNPTAHALPFRMQLDLVSRPMMTHRKRAAHVASLSQSELSSRIPAKVKLLHSRAAATVEGAMKTFGNMVDSAASQARAAGRPDTSHVPDPRGRPHYIIGKRRTIRRHNSERWSDDSAGPSRSSSRARSRSRLSRSRSRSAMRRSRSSSRVGDDRSARGGGVATLSMDVLSLLTIGNSSDSPVTRPEPLDARINAGARAGSKWKRRALINIKEDDSDNEPDSPSGHLGSTSAAGLNASRSSIALRKPPFVAKASYLDRKTKYELALAQHLMYEFQVAAAKAAGPGADADHVSSSSSSSSLSESSAADNAVEQAAGRSSGAAPRRRARRPAGVPRLPIDKLLTRRRMLQRVRKSLTSRSFRAPPPKSQGVLGLQSTFEIAGSAAELGFTADVRKRRRKHRKKRRQAGDRRPATSAHASTARGRLQGVAGKDSSGSGGWDSESSGSDSSGSFDFISSKAARDEYHGVKHQLVRAAAASRHERASSTWTIPERRMPGSARQASENALKARAFAEFQRSVESRRLKLTRKYGVKMHALLRALADRDPHLDASTRFADLLTNLQASRRRLINGLHAALEDKDVERSGKLARKYDALSEVLRMASGAFHSDQDMDLVRDVAEAAALERAVAVEASDGYAWFAALVADVVTRAGSAGHVSAEEHAVLIKLKRVLHASGGKFTRDDLRRVLGSIAQEDFRQEGVQYILLKVRVGLQIQPSAYHALLKEAALPVPKEVLDQMIAAPFNKRFPTLRAIVGENVQPEALQAYKMVTANMESAALA
ncbi:uncharacterized protein AMSG_04741 [Thecamonas trahens ATCC 50062]|uniref:Uncharacterized protein n=1 Tax=Thecamonas trahens ATCC 50062 TaxID=461836 RepID=A0A0L0D9E4_THETB|nr:hypothetical protein AMSG_04741 [Thecamonas trahens ATCC 50062]KNC48997.1 hypothetical protein AMSG_04741 [Thecamonas trahens ATCC 50062]|eukprot:XP_013758410.1 hypothetical protein AMSG_04741 [Thecamonas trahens ATCC 50062]